MPGRPAHERNRALHALQYREDVQLHDLPVVIEIDILDGGAHPLAGVIDGDVHAAEFARAASATVAPRRESLRDRLADSARGARHYRDFAAYFHIHTLAPAGEGRVRIYLSL
jgi:hypothetical protein